MMQRRTLLLGLLATLLIAGAGLFVQREPIGRALGRQLVREDALLPGDAIVVLGGDVHKRAPHAAVLWNDQLAPVVLAVGGTAAQGPLAESQKTAKVLFEQGLPRSAVLVLGQDEPSTVDEALATAQVARERGWTRLLVVTSPYHTRRAGRIFDDAVGDDVDVVMVASPLDPYDPDAWWQDPQQRRRVRNEYGKYLIYRVAGR